MKAGRKKQTLLITIVELILLAAAVFCIFNIVHSRQRVDTNVEETALTKDEQKRLADLGKKNLTLVNKDHEVPEDYEYDIVDTEGGYRIDSMAKKQLEAMMEACREAGCDPVICSAYRTHELQQELYDNEAQPYLDQGMDEDEAYAKAGESVARPGTSEHECGLAVDIIDAGYQVLDDKQEETETQQWLMKHCQEYGFILRYPNGMTDKTGIIYEPWHYRYVGKNHAEYIMAHKDMCFEDYIEELQDLEKRQTKNGKTEK